ncbi:hypothetical protein [Zhihengliuella salsuginis]|uniref:Uncharacterized protein n=1 Tax=Zhihengliuella salsuginis TaxID=578222 RepID=A0ABQ3GH25_9MICC|nr:hypothetical protein [Zhihengliuella salsuginis]GHD06239.1 hypothetical protein GCM10008096_15990 [Zhihengliuella salsuginis]
MDNEIELISDGDGVAVIGETSSVERFLASEGLPSRELGLQRLGSTFSAASAATQAGSGIAANSGRWVKLTQESAQALKKYDAMKGSASEFSRAVVTDKGKIKGILEFSKTAKLGSSAGPFLTNPALLTGAAGIMAQVAMQQTMDEITDYLAVIDEKVDDLLRAQKDAVLADMIGVDLTIDEAMTVREHTGRVSEVTWSKVQATSGTIARTQAYSLRQLDALAGKLESKKKMGDLAEATREAEEKVQEWLAVLARCFQLQEAIAVLELDRVLDSTPEELDQHRLGVKVARQNRIELISQSTERLMGRMDVAAGTANAKVLFSPTASQSVVRSSNHVSTAVVEFHGVLGVDHNREALEAKRWLEAAGEARDKVLETGVEGAESVRRFGTERFDQAKSLTGKISGGLAERAFRRRAKDEEPDEQTALERESNTTEEA